MIALPIVLLVAGIIVIQVTHFASVKVSGILAIAYLLSTLVGLVVAVNS